MVVIMINRKKLSGLESRPETIKSRVETQMVKMAKLTHEYLIFFRRAGKVILQHVLLCECCYRPINIIYKVIKNANPAQRRDLRRHVLYLCPR